MGGQKGLIFGEEADYGIHYVQDQVGPGSNQPGAANSLGLHRVFRLPDPGGVQEPDRYAVQIQGGLNIVPCSAMDFGDYGPLFPQQAIEQGRLACIGTARGSDAGAILE